MVFSTIAALCSKVDRGFYKIARFNTLKIWYLDLVPLQSKFFPTKSFFYILEKGILAGKRLLFKRVNLLCKEGFSFIFLVILTNIFQNSIKFVKNCMVLEKFGNKIHFRTKNIFVKISQFWLKVMKNWTCLKKIDFLLASGLTHAKYAEKFVRNGKFIGSYAENSHYGPKSRNTL